ncbi:hypothetical protein LEA_03347 [human gut metagenome]|uniref:Uncharacterized protein n=1 Tax=human gut metagenome TaxID=408170 RepID=K1V405_9ZZZZ
MKYFVECCGCDYRNGKTKGVNMGLGVENSVKSGRESDLSDYASDIWEILAYNRTQHKDIMSELNVQFVIADGTIQIN